MAFRFDFAIVRFSSTITPIGRTTPMSKAASPGAEPVDDRPDDCSCLSSWDLPCWPCYRVGFETANPEAPAPEEVVFDG